MSSNRFPKYDSHVEAKVNGCFRCESDLSNQQHYKGGDAEGEGEFYIICPWCGMRTYYDIRKR